MNAHEKYDFLKDDKLLDYEWPSIYVFYEGSYYLYDHDYGNVSKLEHFVNRILNPFLILKSEEDIDTFLDIQV